MTAQEKWDYDLQREKDINSFDYVCFIFWEKDLKENGFEIIKSTIADFKKKQKVLKESLTNDDKK